MRRDIAEVLHISHMSIESDLESIGYGKHFDVWVTRNLMKKIIDHISFCDFLFKRGINAPILNGINAGYEKEIVYKSVVRKISRGKRIASLLTTSKAGLNSKDVMLFNLIG